MVSEAHAGSSRWKMHANRFDVVAGRETNEPTGENVAPKKKSANFGLTQRELEVLAFVAQGRTNQDIATTLGIALATVKVHVAHILKKMNASNRTRAALIAINSGLLD